MQKNIFLILLGTLLMQSHLFAQKAPVVIELFTSQGCSSCPPADQLIADIEEQYKGEEVYILSYHVDYWDYIGWKDPFGSKAYTEKQYDYASRFRSRSVYTPQAVINGREHFTGSNRSQLYSRLKHYQTKAKKVDIQLTEISQEHQGIVVDYKLASILDAKEITIAAVVKERTTVIKRGENRNRTLKNTHIVIAEKTLELSTDKGQVNLSIPDWVEDKDSIEIIAYATSPTTGIVGATAVNLK